MGAATVRILPQNSRGFTLVELMMAILITVIGLMGLLQSVNLAMEYNLKNQLRDEAVLIGEKQMGALKAMPFDQVPSSSSMKVDSRLRGGFAKFYNVSSVSRTWSAPDQPSSKLLIVPVTWTYKGIKYRYEVRSTRSQ
ncbi:MAG TPA: prepilin-type N-terminal cleavage/methylation domain-containing protein [Geobacteraceae bacterium]